MLTDNEYRLLRLHEDAFGEAKALRELKREYPQYGFGVGINHRGRKAEIQCIHGIGHALWDSLKDDYAGTHGCDGCCHNAPVVPIGAVGTTMSDDDYRQALEILFTRGER